MNQRLPAVKRCSFLSLSLFCNDAFFVLSVNYRGIHGYGKVPLLTHKKVPCGGDLKVEAKR